jgi:hypothetical protein
VIREAFDGYKGMAVLHLHICLLGYYHRQTPFAVGTMTETHNCCTLFRELVWLKSCAHRDEMSKLPNHISLFMCHVVQCLCQSLVLHGRG